MKPQIMLTRAIALATTLIGLATTASQADEVWLGPSYACAKAQTVIEKAICTDTELAALDLAMAKLYKQALAANSDGTTAIKDAQRAAMSERNSCAGSGDDLRDCLKQSYLARISALMHQSGSVGPLPQPGIYLPIWQPMSSGLTVDWVDEATLSVDAVAIMGAKQGCEAKGTIAGSPISGGFGFLGTTGRVNTELPILRVVDNMLIIVNGPGTCTPGSQWPPVWLKAD
ncbi:MAG: hypothetical protein P8X51_09360 [Maritimibacter sp.]